MKNIKKISVLCAVVLCMATMLLVLAGCSGDKATDIYITKADMPRVEYVEGQDLDLSDGRLTVVTGSGEKKVALTDPKVSVSGYNKNQLGEQSVTIQYDGLTATIEVTVKARVTATNFETNYFVGDLFNKNVGKLQVVADDMTVSTVSLSDERVSVVSFDTSKTGIANVVLGYTENGNTYQCQFSVTVYQAGEMEFTAPDKTAYNSYDAGVDLNGGFFMVTSADNKLVKQVPLTAEMVEGFDLSAATIADRETPLNQTIKIKYLGKEYTYDIQITFAGVSVIEYYAQNGLASINWEKAKEEGLPEDINKIALDAIQEYYRMPSELRETLSDDVKSLISRAGVIAAVKAFGREMEHYSDTIAVDGAGNLYLLTPTYEQVKRDAAKLMDPAELINVYAELLRNIQEEFGDNRMDEELTIGNLIAVYSRDTKTALTDALDHLMYIHELTRDIPENWNAEMLKDYADVLMQATMQIYNTGYYAGGFGSYYMNVLVNWRAQGDLFDILYTYFLYDYEDEVDFLHNYMWGNVPLPGTMQNWYSSLSTAVYYAEYFSNNNTTVDVLLADTTPYMFYYLQTLEYAEEIKNSNNQLLLDLYEVYDVDQMNYGYLYVNPYGYLHMLKGMEDSEAVNALWNEYFQVLKLYGKESLSAEENEEQLRSMFAAFEQLDPSELLGFLSSISNYYNNARGALPLLSYDEETAYVTFTEILRDYYVPYLNEGNQPLFATLLQAMENFALIGFKDSAASQFTGLMASLTNSYDNLSPADKANFDHYAGTAYAKYLSYYQLLSNNSGITMTAKEKALFDELELTLKEYIIAYVTIRNTEQSGQTVTADAYAVTCALRSHATKLYEQIKKDASTNVQKLLFVRSYDLQGNWLTLAQAYFMVDEYCVNLMEAGSVNLALEDGTVQQVAAWDAYTKYGLNDILSDMAHLLFQSYFSDEMTLGGESVISLMATMREMTPAQRSLLSVMGAADAYYRSLGRYLNLVLSEEAKNADVVANTINMEIAYTAYALDPNNAEHYASFNEFVENVTAVYDSLSATDKQYIGDNYHFYLRLYEQLKAEAAA